MHANTKKMVTAALLAAFTCISTMVIKIQTPTFGYIHLGDGLVLLCGILMGPAAGALAAGIGSMLADIFSGYASFAPATLIIKALTAFTAGFLFHKLTRRLPSGKARRIGVLASGLPAEAVMTAGYFLYEAGLAAISSGGFTKAALAAGVTASFAGVPFNAVQGAVGVAICLALLPILQKIPNIWTETNP